MRHLQAQCCCYYLQKGKTQLLFLKFKYLYDPLLKQFSYNDTEVLHFSFNVGYSFYFPNPHSIRYFSFISTVFSQKIYRIIQKELYNFWR